MGVCCASNSSSAAVAPNAFSHALGKQIEPKPVSLEDRKIGPSFDDTTNNRQDIVRKSVDEKVLKHDCSS